MKKNVLAFACGCILLGFTACGSNGSLKDGDYKASVQGMNDTIDVTVTIAKKAISAVTVTKESETPGIGSSLKDASGNVLTGGGEAPVTFIPAEIVKYQTVNVDTVSGATITSGAIKAAVRDCLKQAGAKEDAFNKPMPAPEAPKDTSADVVVVGGGGAGLAAAIAAGQKNASVVIVEKNGEIGGDTLVCGAIYNTPDKDLQSKVTMTAAVKTTIEKALAEKPVSADHAALQAEVKKQWNAYKASSSKDLFDTKEWYALQTWNGGDKVANLNMVKVLCYNAYDDLGWIESLGMKFNPIIGQGAGSLWQRTHTSTMQMGTGFISTYVENLGKLTNIKLMTETTAKSLVKGTDGNVTGVVCTDRRGNKFTISAKDGVILATGGFAANSKMVQQYNTSGKWSDLSKTSTTNRIGCSQGDGISMAVDAGAALTDMEQIQLLYLGNTKDGQLTKYPPRDVNGTDQIIFINKEGKRFTNEGGRRDDICLGVLKQTDKIFYMLESGDGAGYKDIADPSWKSADGFTFDYLLKNGYIFKADTLDDLAKQLSMDPATLKATIDTFNKSVETGKDEFGRTLYSTKLTKGPWIATPRQACLHHTMGGVKIDEQTHVLDANGKAIKGLYAAGEITGGIHGANRLGGNAVVDTVVFGKLAGDSVMKDVQ